MMSNQLVPLNAMPVSKYADDAVFKNVAGTAYLPRVQLFGSSNKQVKKRLIGQGHFGLVRSTEDIVDLGEQFSTLVLAWRPKAIRMKEGKATVYFNPKDPEFQAVEKAGKAGDKNCMFGPEFLLCLSEHDRQFATWLFGNGTLRKRAPFMKTCMHGAAALESELIEWNGYSWYGPKIEKAAMISGVPEDPELFQAFQEEVRQQCEAFNNPPTDEIVEEASEERER
jgi:hypothetical protein